MSGDIQEGITPPVNTTIQAMEQTRADETVEMASEQESSQEAFQMSLQEAVNPFTRMRNTEKTLKAHSSRVQKMLKAGEKGQRLGPIVRIKNSADQFQQRNPELKSSTLVMLREMIKPGDSKEEILKKLLDVYPDVSLADEVLEFLLETTDGELHNTIQEAKEAFNKQHEREITAGRNIGLQAREAADKGLGSPTNLRDMYRDITGNPRDSSTLFQELSQRYAFKELKKVVDFLLHSLGADMKSKGPSIAPGQLYRLLSETRSLQAILGVYRFFRMRMPLINKLFTKEGIEVPSQLNFEAMAKQFMSLAGERYPSEDKVLQTAVRLGIEKWIMAKIIALSQFRDAVREVAANQIYRSMQHRDELYLAILEALEALEDELEELLEQQQSEQEGKEEEEESEEDEEENDESEKKEK